MLISVMLIKKKHVSPEFLSELIFAFQENKLDFLELIFAY